MCDFGFLGSTSYTIELIKIPQQRIQTMLVELYIFAVFILSSFLQTSTGFGYAIITAPLLALVLEPKETIMLTMFTGLIIRIMMLKTTRNDGSYKTISPLVIASIFGAIPGAYCMSIISNESLKIFIGAILFVFTFLLWKNYRLPIKNSTFTKTVAGFLSGFLATTTSINGPPIILYYLSTNEENNKNVLRGNLTRYFLLINIASIIISYFAGTFKLEDLWLQTLRAIPPLYLGFYLGEKFFHQINIEIFKKMALLLVFVCSILLMGSTLSIRYYPYM